MSSLIYFLLLVWQAIERNVSKLMQYIPLWLRQTVFFWWKGINLWIRSIHVLLFCIKLVLVQTCFGKKASRKVTHNGLFLWWPQEFDTFPSSCGKAKTDRNVSHFWWHTRTSSILMNRALILYFFCHVMSAKNPINSNSKNGVLLPKLFWPTVRKNVLVIKKHVKFKAEGQEFANILSSLEQFVRTVKAQ